MDSNDSLPARDRILAGFIETQMKQNKLLMRLADHEAFGNIATQSYLKRGLEENQKKLQGFLQDIIMGKTLRD